MLTLQPPLLKSGVSQVGRRWVPASYFDVHSYRIAPDQVLAAATDTLEWSSTNILFQKLQRGQFGFGISLACYGSKS
jgi:hypothetical protein